MTDTYSLVYASKLNVWNTRKYLTTDRRSYSNTQTIIIDPLVAVFLLLLCFLMVALLFWNEAKARRNNKSEFMTSSLCALVACHTNRARAIGSDDTRTSHDQLAGI